MLYRTRTLNGHAISNQRLQKIKIRFKAHTNGHISQSKDTRKYLSSKDAKGCCFNQYLILLGANPSLSCVLEELIHAIQHKTGIHNARTTQVGNAAAIIVCEFEAALLLNKYGLKWGIPWIERKENAQRLLRWRSLRFQKGISQCLLNSKLLKSMRLVMQELGCLTGKF